MLQETEHDKTAGFALASVLVFLLLLAAFLTPFAIAARVRLLTQDHIFHDFQLSNQLNVLAKIAAINYGTLTRSQKEKILTNPVGCELGLNRLLIKFTDHSGLIDLNASSAELLSIGLEANGVSNANNIAREIINYRSIQSSVDQISSQIEFGLKHAPFEAVSELHDFTVLRTIPLDALENTFTTLKKSGVLNATYAPQNLRRVIEQKNSANGLTFVANELLPSSIISIDLAIQSDTSLLKREKFMGRVSSDRKQSFKNSIRSSVGLIKADWKNQPITVDADQCASLIGTDVLEFVGAQI